MFLKTKNLGHPLQSVKMEIFKERTLNRIKEMKQVNKIKIFSF